MDGKNASVFFRNFQKESEFSRLIPEQVIQRHTQHPADAYTKPDCGIIIPFFDGVDGLPGDTQALCQLLLGKPRLGPGIFHGVVFSHGLLLLPVQQAQNVHRSQRKKRYAQ